MQLHDATMMEAADALLDAGVSLPLCSLRIPFKRNPLELRIHTRRPSLGAQIRISRKYLELGVSYEQVQAMSASEQAVFVATHGNTLSELIALCVLTGYISGRLYKPLSWLIRWQSRPEHLLAITLGYISLLGTRSFWTIIGFVEGKNPLRPSHNDQGS
ncbi:MAG: hypothetical protein SPI72_03290 [Porphyromonas sp.]|nr:hypothetical protein [Porphyromonas sp.]